MTRMRCDTGPSAASRPGEAPIPERPPHRGAHSALQISTNYCTDPRRALISLPKSTVTPNPDSISFFLLSLSLIPLLSRHRVSSGSAYPAARFRQLGERKGKGEGFPIFSFCHSSPSRPPPMRSETWGTSSPFLCVGGSSEMGEFWRSPIICRGGKADRARDLPLFLILILVFSPTDTGLVKYYVCSGCPVRHSE